MGALHGLGWTLLVSGLLLAAVGLALLFADKIPFLGRLPGDVIFRRGNFTLYFPIVTTLLLSILLTVVLNLFLRR